MVFNQAPEGIFIHGAENHLLDVNKTVLEALGYTREKLGSMKVPDLEEVRQRAHEERPRREPDQVDIGDDPRSPRNDAREVGRRHPSHELGRTQIT